MNKKILSILMTLVVLTTLLAGCAGSTPVSDESASTAPQSATHPEETQAVSETESSAEEHLDLESLYHQGVAVLSQMSDDAPVLFPETDVNYLENFYPGLAQIELKQLYAGVAPVTNAPFEIILLEVANREDVQTVMDIFQARVDEQSGDSSYPENAEAWMHNTKITSRGNYVFLAVLMDPFEIPSEFILD